MDAFEDIKDALREKGVDVPDNATFSDLPGLIDKIFAGEQVVHYRIHMKDGSAIDEYDKGEFVPLNNRFAWAFDNYDEEDEYGNEFANFKCKSIEIQYSGEHSWDPIASCYAVCDMEIPAGFAENIVQADDFCWMSNDLTHFVVHDGFGWRLFSASNMFSAPNLRHLDLPTGFCSHREFSITTSYSMFAYSGIKEISFPRGFCLRADNYGRGSTMDSWFQGCVSLTRVSFNSDFLSEVSVTAPSSRMRYIAFVKTFKGCSSLEYVNLPVANGRYNSGGWSKGFWEADLGSEVFSGCTSLQTVEIPSRYGVAIDCGGLFDGCASLRSIRHEGIDNYFRINTWKDGEYISTARMFAGCSSIVDLKVYNSESSKCYCEEMFDGCTSLKTLTIRYLKPDFYVQGMFRDCQSLEILDVDDGFGKYVEDPLPDPEGREFAPYAEYMFDYCYSLKTIRGRLLINASLDFRYCPLAYSTFRSILDNLPVANVKHVLQLGDINWRYMSKALYDAATEKGWIVTR